MLRTKKQNNKRYRTVQSIIFLINLLFDISNKFFEICELLDEYEVIPIDQITSKILILDFNYKKKAILATTFVSDHN
jgi:hypothetical protein